MYQNNTLRFSNCYPVPMSDLPAVNEQLQKFVVRHGPLPWIGNKKLDTCDLKQFYVKKCSFLKRNIPTYEIHAITRNDKNIKLIGGIPSSEQALDIEREVRKYLGIEVRHNFVNQ